jgi:hypothetical protein
VQAEGWYRDPYEIHDDRWFSDGRPTRLSPASGESAVTALDSPETPREWRAY